MSIVLGELTSCMHDLDLPEKMASEIKTLKSAAARHKIYAKVCEVALKYGNCMVGEKYTSYRFKTGDVEFVYEEKSGLAAVGYKDKLVFEAHNGSIDSVSAYNGFSEWMVVLNDYHAAIRETRDRNKETYISEMTSRFGLDISQEQKRTPLTTITAKYIYFRKDLVLPKGLLSKDNCWAYIHVISCECEGTLRDYMEMSRCIRKDFPAAINGELSIARIKDFGQYKNGHMIHWTGVIKEQSYPGWICQINVDGTPVVPDYEWY